MAAKKKSNHPLARRSKNKDPLIASEARELIALETMLFGSSPAGGRGLQDLLSLLKHEGPYTHVRSELIAHLHRCLEQAIRAETFIMARARAGKPFPKKCWRDVAK
jgi:hypothetical protein